MSSFVTGCVFMVLQGLPPGHWPFGMPMSDTAQSRFIEVVFQCIWEPKYPPPQPMFSIVLRKNLDVSLLRPTPCHIRICIPAMAGNLLP